MANRNNQQITREDLDKLSTTGNFKDIRIVKIKDTTRLTFSGAADKKMESVIEKAHFKAIDMVCSKIHNDEHKASLQALNINCEFNTRMRTKGGDASYFERQIRMNYRLHKDNADEVLETYLHELAHIFNYILYPKHSRSHGWEWENVMFLMDRKPDRCHTMDVEKYKRKVKRYVYTCSCKNKEFKLTGGEHKRSEKVLVWGKVLGGAIGFSCKVCKSSLAFSGNLVKV